jgi:hypothetical protein
VKEEASSSRGLIEPLCDASEGDACCDAVPTKSSLHGESLSVASCID